MRRLHWIITLQWHDHDGLHIKTADGLTEPSPSATRRDVYRDALRTAADLLDADEPAVLMFTLERDVL